MSRIGLHTFDTPEVELGGHVYTITPATRSVTTKAKALEERVETEDADQLIAAYGELLDLRLAGDVKGQPKASTTLRRMWEANDVSLPQVMRLLADISATDRPI